MRAPLTRRGSSLAMSEPRHYPSRQRRRDARRGRRQDRMKRWRQPRTEPRTRRRDSVARTTDTVRQVAAGRSARAGHRETASRRRPGSVGAVRGWMPPISRRCCRRPRRFPRRMGPSDRTLHRERMPVHGRDQDSSCVSARCGQPRAPLAARGRRSTPVVVGRSCGRSDRDQRA